MTYFHACAGCATDKAVCEAHAAFKEKIKGLGITSVKWRCADRVDRFHKGQSIWALTTVFSDGEEYREQWPGHVIRLRGTSALVYIKPGAQAKDFDYELPFEPASGGRGFCRIPLSRLSPRSAASDETICAHCELPSFAGHHDGYICSLRLSREVLPEEAGE